MSFFAKISKKLNPNEDVLNNLVNSSFCGKFYNAITRLISFIRIRLNLNSDIITYVDSAYLVLLGILIFTLPFVNSSMLGILASGLITLSIIKSLFGHKKFRFSALHLPIFIYLLIMLLSVGFSSLFMPSLKGFAKMLIYIATFFSFFEFLKRNPKRIFPVIVMVAISTCIELLFTFKQMIFGVSELASWQDKTTLNPEATMNRIFGTLKPYNPNLLAAYLLSTTPFIFIASLYAFITKKIKLSVIFAIFSVLALLAIIKTGCRGAYIGLFTSLIFFIAIIFDRLKKHILNNKKLLRILIITGGSLLFIGIIIALLSPDISHRISSIFTLRGDSSNSFRMNVYTSSLKMFFDNWLVGIGPGNTTFRLIYGLYMVTGFDALGAYNIYLEMAIESGIFLLLTFIWLMYLTYTKAIKRLRHLPIKLNMVIIACLTAITAMLFHGFFDTIWYRPQIQLLFWLYMAVIAVITLKGFVYGKK